MNFLGSLRRLSLAVVVATLFIAGTVRSQVTTKDPANKPAPEPTPSKYAGAEVCKTCHEEQFNSLEKTRHWDNVLKTKDGTEAHSCETCHGPGVEHVNSGGDKSKIFNFNEATPREITKR